MSLYFHRSIASHVTAIALGAVATATYLTVHSASSQSLAGGRLEPSLDCGVLHFTEPGFTPENHARFLTAVVRSTGTAETVEKDDVISSKLAKARGRLFRVVTGFQNTFGNLESLPTELHHFRHERQLV